MKKTGIIFVCTVAAIVVLLGTYIHMRAHNPMVVVYNQSSPSIYFPCVDGMAEISPGVRMYVDTGCVLSVLSPEDLERLRDNGAEITEHWFPTIGVDIYGKAFMSTRRYRISLPVVERKHVTDSLGNITLGNPTGNVSAMVSDLIFIPGPSGQPSIIGTDILENFVMEYQFDSHTLALHKTRPAGYQYVSNVYSTFAVTDLIGSGQRYYVDITTDNVNNPYFINTGIRHAQLKLPMADTTTVKQSLHTYTYTTTRGEVHSRYINSAWVKIGNRAGSHVAHYADDGEEAYAFNPMNFFSQDVVIDFINGGLYLRTHSELRPDPMAYSLYNN